MPRFAVPPYPASQQRFFHQHPAEQPEEREYERALAVISNYHRHQAENEATARRHRYAEAARQRYLAVAIELEQRRQRAELVASHRAEILRTHQARARLAAAEYQIAVNQFLGRSRGNQPVRCSYIVAGLVLIFPQATNQPQFVNRKPFSRVLKQHPTSESVPNVTERIRSIPTSLGSRPVHSEDPENLNHDSAKLIEDFLSSLFPGLVFRAEPEAGDNKTAPTLHAGGHEEPTRKPGTAGLAANSRFSDPSPTKESTSPVNLDATETEQVFDCTTSLSSIEHIRNNLAKLKDAFILPTQLDYYSLSANDHDGAASVSSISPSDFTKLIPYTSKNKSIYEYEHQLSGLLEELDRVESHGDVEVRDKRKEVVKAVERALEGVEQVVGEVVKERLSVITPNTSVIEGSLKGFDVDEDITEETVLGSAEDQVDTPVAIGGAVAPEEPTPTHLEAAVSSVGEYSPAEGTILESSSLVDNATTSLHDGSSPTQLEVGLSTSTPAPEPVEIPVAETESTEPQPPSEEADASDPFLLAEELLPHSPAKEVRLIESDTEDGVIVLDDDEKSDWSDVEH